MFKSVPAMLSASSQSTLFRCAVSIGVVASLTTYLPDSGQEIYNIYLLVGVAIVLAYLLSTAVVQRLYQDSEELPKVLNYMGHLDALLLGGFVALTDFNLISTGVFFVMVQYRALTNGGAKRLLQDTLAFACGILLVFVFREPTLKIDLSQQVNTVTMVILALYFCVFAYMSFARNNEFEQKLAAMEKEQVRLKMLNYQFSKYVSPNLRKKIEQGREVKLSTQRKRLVVFFSDIVGFSEIADEMDESALTVLINSYLTEMSKIALEYGGTIDKFIGDAIMVFFGDPTTKGPKEDCIACVSMALAMRRKSAELQARWKNDGLLKPLQMRMGISTGFCTVGNFGTEIRLDYTLLGSEVNLASRLETTAKAGEILVSQATFELIKDVIQCEDKGAVEAKGFKYPIKTYAVIDFRSNLGKNQSFVDFTTNGFSLIMDAEKVANYDRTKVVKALREAIRHFLPKDPAA